MDTIFALATPLGGALAIVRISGPQSAAILERLFSGNCAKEPRRMRYGRLCDVEGHFLEDCMAVFFPAPASYSGEDMAELYIHGGAAGAQRALAALGGTRLCRAAAPGEFTKRAFLNGKIALSRAEAVMDYIAALSERAAKAAGEQLQGKLHERVRAIEAELTALLAEMDAAIDYPEEMEDEVRSKAPEALEGARAALLALAKNGMDSRLLREGARIVICGRPNAGKSSLLNALLGRDRAIVTPMAGATRDTLEEGAVFCGLPVRLTDTAGLREACDEAEKQGVSRSEAAMAEADLLLLCFDASQAPDEAADMALLKAAAHKKRILLFCKADLPLLYKKEGPFADALCISAKHGEGLEEIRERAARMLLGAGAESPAVTNRRHIEAFEKAAAALSCALRAPDAECAATDLREALLHIGAVTGSAVDEAVIDAIFSRFCVGK